MGVKDNRQRLLVIGNEKDIKTFKENDSDITKLNQWYASSVEVGNSWDGPSHEIDTTPNLVDMKYKIVGEGMDTESFRIMHYYLEEVITRYPNLNFVWTTIYDRSDVNTYIIKHNVRDTPFQGKTIKFLGSYS